MSSVHGVVYHLVQHLDLVPIYLAMVVPGKLSARCGC